MTIRWRSVAAVLMVAGVILVSGCRTQPWNHVQFGPPEEGRFAKASPDGNLEHTYYDEDLFREIKIMGKLADRNTVEPGVWVTKVYILRNIEADWTDKEGVEKHYSISFTDEEVEALKEVTRLYEEWVWAYSGGCARLDVELEVIDEPLTRLEGAPDMPHPWTAVINDVAGDNIETNKVDAVMVFWKVGDLPHDNIWGLTGAFAYKGASYSWVGKVYDGLDEAAYAEVTLHEWLHQVEYVCQYRMGYGGMPDLHMAHAMGYQESYKFGVSHDGWMRYYRDFMSVYMTPAMWQQSTVDYHFNKQTRPRFDGGWVTDWLIAGPFSNDGETGLDNDFIGETDVLPDLNQPAGAADGLKDGGQGTWKTAKVEALLNFLDQYDINTMTVAYAHTYVYSPVEQDTVIWAGSDDALAIWLNGRQVWVHRMGRGVAPDEDQVPITLKEGWNRLLFKVDQGGGGWGLQVRLSNADGGPLDNAKFQPDKPSDPATIVPTEHAVVVAKDGPWQPEYFAWDDVRNNPWRLLPKLDQNDLRRLTGDPELVVNSDKFTVSLVPGPGRGIAEAGDAQGETVLRVDSTLNFHVDTLESLAWLRYDRNGRTRDLLLLRADVIDVLFEKLDELEDASAQVVGRMHAGNHALIVVETHLAWDDARGTPATELHMLRGGDDNLSVNLQPERLNVEPGDNVTCVVEIKNNGAEAVTLGRIRIVPALDELKVPKARYYNRTVLAPGETQLLTLAVSVPSDGIGPGPVPLRALVSYVAGNKGSTASDLAVLKIPAPPEPEEPEETEAAEAAPSGEPDQPAGPAEEPAQ